MYKRWILCLIIVVALAGCMGNQGPEVNYTITPVPTLRPPHVIFPVKEPTTVEVVIFGSAFDPPYLDVVNGTTVRWINRDSSKYIINGSGFRSPELNKHENWSHTFNETGTFVYDCPNHTYMPHGTIIVKLAPPINNT